MSTIIRNAIREAVRQAFSGKERAALLEAVLHQVLVNGEGVTLTLDEAQQLDTDRMKVAIDVAADGAIKVTATTAEPSTRKA